MSLCYDILESVGKQVQIIRQTNNNKKKFNHMIKSYNLHNEELREAVIDLDENHMISYIQYYRKIDSEHFISCVNHRWVKNFDKMNGF